MSESQPPIDPLKQIDNALIEPARFGLRKFGTGLGKVASGGLMIGGGALGGFGALLLLITEGAILGTLGGLSAAAGAVALLFGAIGYFAVGRADTKADYKAVERRIIKLVTARGSLTDAEIARRIRERVETVRKAADNLVRRDVLDVDIDRREGADRYTLSDTYVASMGHPTPERALPAAEQHELRAFEAKVAAAQQEQTETAKLEVAEHVEYER